MKKTEIEEIIKNAAQKQSWVVKGLNDFLDAWEEIEVPEGYQGPKKCYLFEIENEYSGDVFKYFISLRSSRLDYDLLRNYSGELEESEQWPKITIKIARRAIAAIETSITKFLEKISTENDGDDEAAKKIRRITEALKDNYKCKGASVHTTQKGEWK